MDISPTQLHPPAKRAVFQSPLTVPPTSCTSPLLTTQVNTYKEAAEPLTTRPPAFDTSRFQTTFNNHSEMSTYDHTPLSLPGTKKHGDYSTDHTHQCVESAFLPFKTANGLTPPTSIQQSEQMDEQQPHFDSIPSLNPVTTIS